MTVKELIKELQQYPENYYVDYEWIDIYTKNYYEFPYEEYFVIAEKEGIEQAKLYYGDIPECIMTL